MIGFVIRVGEATTSTFTREMDGGIWRYTYEAGNGREITIAKVSVNFSKSEILDAYRRLNQQYAASLIGRTSQQPRDVDVALTFTRPLSFEEVMEIRRNTGLSAQLYTVVAMNEDDEKGTLTVVAGEDSAISMSKANEMIASQGFKFMGIMVIHGKISNSQGGLGRLLADNRIYLVDMTANRVREDLLANGEHLDQVREMYVHIPSPFWDMPWK
ncbi:MAG: hypothetical protein RMK99_02125 [Anaerolineales bacterium]|nr:hypothetical protein [Anaerolineales bacterium]